MNSVAPNSPSETAAQNPAATANARAVIGSRPRARPPRPGAEHRRRVAQPRVDAAQRGHDARTTNGIATTACAIGTSNGEVARPRGACSNASRKPNPTVTAEVPSGSIRNASNAARRPPGPRGDRDRRQPADDQRDRRSRSPRTRASCAPRSTARRTTSSSTRSSRARDTPEAPVPADVQRAPRPARRAAPPRKTVVAPRIAADDQPLAPPRPARRVRPRRPAAARPPRRSWARAEREDDREDGDDLHERERGRGRQVEQLDRLAVDLDFERRVRGIGEQQRDAERREREQEHDRRGRDDRRREQRQGHVPEGPRRATRRACAPLPRAADRGSPRTRPPCAPRPRR